MDRESFSARPMARPAAPTMAATEVTGTPILLNDVMITTAQGVEVDASKAASSKETTGQVVSSEALAKAVLALGAKHGEDAFMASASLVEAYFDDEMHKYAKGMGRKFAATIVRETEDVGPISSYQLFKMDPLLFFNSVAKVPMIILGVSLLVATSLPIFYCTFLAKFFGWISPNEFHTSFEAFSLGTYSFVSEVLADFGVSEADIKKIR